MIQPICQLFLALISKLFKRIGKSLLRRRKPSAYGRKSRRTFPAFSASISKNGDRWGLALNSRQSFTLDRIVGCHSAFRYGIGLGSNPFTGETYSLLVLRDFLGGPSSLSVQTLVEFPVGF